jgi:hypothetical protein
MQLFSEADSDPEREAPAPSCEDVIVKETGKAFFRRSAPGSVDRRRRGRPLGATGMVTKVLS